LEKVEHLEEFYQDTGNAVYPLKAFLEGEERAPLPEWVMTWLTEGLRKYEECKAQQSLDVLLGFRRKGKGKRSAFEEFDMIERNRRLIREVIRLQIKLNSKKEATWKITEYEQKKGLKIGVKRVRHICSKKGTLKNVLHGQ
jgi:hypothetical protein